MYDINSFLINLLFYFFTLFVSYILISTLKFFLIIVGAIILFGSIIGFLILIINCFEKVKF